jgi:hypothetical protein
MKFQQHKWIAFIKNKESLTAIGMLAVMTWIANFWHFGSLGLYEDDYFFIGEPIRMNFPEFFDLVKSMTSNFSQGRVVGFNIVFLSAFIGGHLGGIKLVYVIAFIFALINNILFYKFLKVIWDQPFFVIPATLAFALFPADNTKAFLTHIIILPSLTFLLLAFLCYFSQKRIIAYLFIFASLLCYETTFLLFITAPLFKNKWTSEILREFMRNTLILGLIFLGVLILRKVTGDSRISDLDILIAILTLIRQTLIGPFISLSTFFYRPWQTLFNLKGELLLFVPLVFAVFACFFSQLQINQIPQTNKIKNELTALKNLKSVLSIKRLSLLGLSLSFLAYPLTFTVSATEISGRASRVHTAAILGTSILVGIICYLMVYLATTYRQKNLAAIILAGYFSLLVGFGLIVQHDNQRSWQYQQAFWTDVVQLAPDLAAGTVILVDAPSLFWGKQLNPFDWSMYYILGQLYQFPKDWKFIPQLYKLNPNWQNEINADGTLKLEPDSGWGKGLVYYYTQPSRHLKTSEIILLQEKAGKLIRQTEPIIVGSKKYLFKPLTASTLDTFEKGFLDEYLINPSTNKSVNYLKPF